MADGFKIASAFVEISADSRGLREEVRADVAEAAVGQKIDVPVKADTSQFKTAMEPFLGSMRQWVSAAILPAVAAVGNLTGVTALALPAVAGLGLVAVTAKLGFQDMGKAIGGDKKALADLTPAARAAAVQIGALGKGLRVDVQQAMWAGLAGQIKGLGSSILPVVHNGLVGIAGVINDVLHRFLSWAGTAKTVADMSRLFGNLTAAGHILAGAVAPILSIFRDITTVASDFLPGLSRGFVTAAQRAADFVAKARETGQLKEWIQRGIDAFRQLEPIVKNVVKVLGDLSANHGFGSNFLTSLKVVTDGIAWMSDKVPHLGEIVTAFFAVWKLVQLAKGILTIVSLIKDFTVVQWLLNIAMDANPIGIIILAIGALIAIVILAIKHWKEIRQVLDEVWNWMRTQAIRIFGDIGAFIIRIFNDVKNFFIRVWDDIKNFVVRIWNDITGWIRARVDDIKGIINWFGQLPGMISGWFGRAKDGAIGMMGQLVSWVAGLPGRIVGALGNLGGLLVNAGQSLIEGLGRGIENAFGWVKSKVQGLMSNLRGLFPFSPAKEGPFSGSGYTTNSGQAMIRDWARGMVSEQGTVKAALTSVLGSTQLSFAQPSLGLSALAGSGDGSMPVGSSASTTHIASLNVSVAGNLDPTNPTAYRQAISGIRDAIRGVERSFA